MSSFFSILFLTIRPEIQEKISIGLLLSDGKQALFDYSHEKLELSKQFISHDAYKLVKDSITNIKRALKDDNTRKDLSKSTLFVKEEVGKLFSEKHFDYLSNYNTNLFTFTTPQKINLEINKQNFQKLISKLVDEYYLTYKKAHKHTSVHEYVKKNLIPKVRDKVNTYFEVSNDFFDNMIGVVRVDIIGKNGVYVTAQSIEFDKNPLLLTSDIARYELLKNSITNQKEKGNKFFIIGSEPPKELRKEHEVWSDIKKNNLYTYIDKNESDCIREFIDTHEVVKLQ